MASSMFFQPRFQRLSSIDTGNCKQYCRKALRQIHLQWIPFSYKTSLQGDSKTATESFAPEKENQIILRGKIMGYIDWQKIS